MKDGWQNELRFRPKDEEKSSETGSKLMGENETEMIHPENVYRGLFSEL